MLLRKSINNLGLLSIALLIGLAIPASSSHLLASTNADKHEFKPSVCKTTFKQMSSKNISLIACNRRKQTAGKRLCDVGAYVIDKDPQGLNVRSGPGTKYRIIDKLPTIYEIAPVEVRIAASVGNWVMITEAREPAEGKIEFQGSGWVYAPLLGTSISASPYPISLYAQPNKSTPKLGTLEPTTSVKLNTCYGKWVKVEHKNLKGWLAPQDQCPTQITNCS